MAARPSKRKLPEREFKPQKERLKISNKVLDDKVVEVLAWLINTRRIESVDYPISQGKEAVVFRATRKGKDDKDEFVAIKIFKYETSSFKNMLKYIEGDRNFDLRKNRRLLVNDWARKEYSNLQICQKCGVSAPKPFLHRKNVLIMEFLGVGGIQSALLEEVVVENPEKLFLEIVGEMKKISAAGLVHADLSSFNIILHEGRPVIIDWAQGVEIAHPNANAFLSKDCGNIAHFFSRLGVDCSEKKIFDAVAPKTEAWKQKVAGE